MRGIMCTHLIKPKKPHDIVLAGTCDKHKLAWPGARLLEYQKPHLFLAGVCHKLDSGVSTARGVIGREPEKGSGVGEPKALPTPGGLPNNGDS